MCGFCDVLLICPPSLSSFPPSLFPPLFLPLFPYLPFFLPSSLLPPFPPSSLPLSFIPLFPPSLSPPPPPLQIFPSTLDQADMHGESDYNIMFGKSAPSQTTPLKPHPFRPRHLRPGNQESPRHIQLQGEEPPHKERDSLQRR